MKPIWLGIIFFLLYGLFSMKSRAAEEALAAHAVLGGDSRRNLTCLDR
jgi:hypothetical protein